MSVERKACKQILKSLEELGLTEEILYQMYKSLEDPMAIAKFDEKSAKEEIEKTGQLIEDKQKEYEDVFENGILDLSQSLSQIQQEFRDLLNDERTGFSAYLRYLNGKRKFFATEVVILRHLINGVNTAEIQELLFPPNYEFQLF